jgi:hypothetical protein
MRYLPALLIVACGLPVSVAAQPPPPAVCRIIGTVVTCTGLQPVSPAAATAILTAAIAPAVAAVPPPYVPPAGAVYVGSIHGGVFSDQWPYAGAGVYPWMTPAPVVPRPAACWPGDARPPYDPLTQRWYR